MFKRRTGSILAYAISLTALFLSLIVGTMAYFESSSRQAASDKWRDVAEQAARSGLDFVMGWGEAAIDKDSRLPSAWEMNDGEVIDPVRGFLTKANAYAMQPNLTAVFGLANPNGAVLGDRVGEFVVARVNNYLITFKARIQQFRMSNDSPKQYRIGVVGRVRHVPRADAAHPNPQGVNFDTDEKYGILAERVLTATLGKEPFSKYAALIDYDAVKNWVPGEEVQGPVHINRGYVDETGTENVQPGTPTYNRDRSIMRIHVSPGNTGFNPPPGKPGFPRFFDRVTMTASNDGLAKLKSDDTMNGDSFIRVDTIGSVTNATAQGWLNQAFLAPDNKSSLNGQSGPLLIPDPIPLPPNSRRRINGALGIPGTRSLTDYAAAFMPLEDGVYVPTRFMVDNHVTGSGTLTSFSYDSTGPRNYAAGGIYIRGNVEVMRMTVNGQYSYYGFQLGNGLNTGSRRSYIVRVNRVTRVLEMCAFPFTATPTDLVSRFTNTMDNYFGAAVAVTTDPNFFALAGGSMPGRGAAGRMILAPVETTYNNHPFNGVILVDCSKYDPYRWLTPAQQALPGRHAISGNIFALGDPGATNNPTAKTAVFGSPLERVATNDNVDPTAPTNASRLTIVASGHIFIQNHVVLEPLRAANMWNNPVGDNIDLDVTRDLIGLVADRQVLVGLAAPGPSVAGDRSSYGCVVHAAVAALGDPDPTVAGRTGSRAYWGSVATEGMQSMFGLAGEDYDTVNATLITNGATPTGPYYANVGGVWVYTAAAQYHGKPAEDNIPGNSYFHNYLCATKDTNPNIVTRGRLLFFGSVTQKKRGSIGAGNISYDKDFRYDKRLLSIAPPMFPSSTTIALRVSSVFAPGNFPYIGGSTNGNSAIGDLKFFAVPSSTVAASPAP